MADSIFDKISPFLSFGMLTVFAVFVILGMLFGLGRGAKRASIRLVILVGLLIVAFFLTPLISQVLLKSNIDVAGRTPAQSVDEVSDAIVKYLQENFGDYVKPFENYIKDYAVGIVLALVNLVLFLVLYFFVKIFSWSIYAIIARFAAPKRDSEGNKLKRHRGWGLLVGAVQGVLLFVIFLFPVNGVVAMVNQAAVYEAQQANESQSSTQPAATTGSNNRNDSQFDNISAMLEKFNAPMKGYNNFMKYSGLEFLSKKALEYQLTVRVENGENINLVHDINSGFELVVDAKAVSKVMNKFQNAYQDGKLDLTELTESDYRVLRQFLNKAFDLEVLNVANNILVDMEKILSEPYNNDLTKLAGTDIYENSIYGLIIKSATTEREIPYTLQAGETVAPTNYAQFAKGLRAAVNYVSARKLNLVRDDLINIIDLIESWNVYEITYEGVTKTTLTQALAQGGLGAKDYLDLGTARLTKSYGDYTQGTPLINVLGTRLTQFSFVQLISQNDFDNLLLYSKALNNSLSNDEKLKTMVTDLVPMFFGENALTRTVAGGVKVQGNWERLGSVILDVAHVLRDYVTIVDDINAIKADMVENKHMDPNIAQARAVLQYMADLAISKDYFEAHSEEFTATTYNDDVKFQKIDELTNALYRVVNEFPPVKTYLISQLETMKTGEEGDYIQMLIDMLNKEKSEWKSTLVSIVNVADVINNSVLGDLLDQFQNLTEGDSIDNLAEKFFDAVEKVDAGDVGKMLTDLMDIPEVSDTVQDALNEILTEVNTEEKLKEVFGEDADITGVQQDIGDLQQTLNDLKANNLTDEQKETLKQNLQTNVGNLWDVVNHLMAESNESAGA